jgi:hypothetical protein
MLFKNNVDPHLFYEANGGFSLFTQPIKANTEIQIGPKIPLACMFTASWLLVGDERVGYFFQSEFQTINQGGYVVTFLESKRGNATAVEVVLKIEKVLVVYNYPGKGSLIVSPKASEALNLIFSEQ